QCMSTQRHPWPGAMAILMGAALVALPSVGLAAPGTTAGALPGWRAKAPLHQPRVFLGIVPGPDHMIYAIGGAIDLSRQVNAVERYDPKKMQWSSVASMPYAVYSPAATTGLDGRIYVLGGAGGGVTQNLVQVYSPKTDSWALAASMYERRAYLGAATGPNG